MKVIWQFNKCILCLNNSPNTPEHIIPESIGGKLSALILCSNCNHYVLGSKLIGKVKKDPSIRLAIKNLKNEISDLEESIEEGQLYIGRDINNNLLTFIRKNSKFKILEKKKEDNSLIKDTQRAEQCIVKKLQKEGENPSEILEKLEAFRKLEDNKIMQLTNNEKIVKWTIKDFMIDLKGPILDPKVILLIAYEYLSLLIGNLIYEKQLDFIRKYLLNNIESNSLKIDRFRTKKYSPYHKIYPKFFDSMIIITIILFGHMVFEVKLYINLPKVPDYVYLEDLKNKKTMFSNSVEEANQGKYFSLNLNKFFLTF